jgi:hypothetical protein
VSGVGWRFDYRVMSDLPPLAWVAKVAAPLIEVSCGTSVHRLHSGFLEGTWAGPAGLGDIASCPTVFGSGMAVADGELLIVPPSHTHDGVFATSNGAIVTVSNSIVALMAATGTELDPAAPYPTIFCQVAEMKVAAEDPITRLLAKTLFDVPASPRPVTAMFYENVGIDTGGRLAQVRKPREEPFRSFIDYRERLFGATHSLVANAQTYEPVVALSAGYDSTAVAAVGARVGCRRALSLTSGRSFVDGSTVADDGAAVAEALGLDCESFDRLAYLIRADLPEAEFLASGMSGEDVPFSAFELRLRRKVLLTGFWEGDLWVKSKGYPQPYLPGDFSGCTMSEFRLRTDFIHVPLPCFGTFQGRASHPFVTDADMRPFSIGGDYDRAIPRRLAEEAGVPRGSFARSKQAATVLLHREGRAAFAPATVSAIESFAAAQGVAATFAPQPRTGRPQRGFIRAAYALRVPRLVRSLERRRKLAVTFEPEFGALLFRWAVSVVRPRYRALEPAVDAEAVLLP